MNNKRFTYKKQKTPFWHLWVSCLEAGMVTNPNINPYLYSKSSIRVLQIQMDLLTIIKVIAGKPLCLQTDEKDNDRYIT